MLDAFKNRAADSKRGGKLVDERQELERLIQTARGERFAMDETLRSLKTRAATLKPIGEFLDRIDEKVSGVATTLDHIGERLDAVDGRTQELERLDEHIQRLRDTAREAQQSAEKAINATGELVEHRKVVEQLSTHAKQAQESLHGLRTEHAAFEELRGALRVAQTEIKQSVDYAGTLRGELDAVRGMTADLTDDVFRVSETSRTAREDTGAAMAAIKEVEKKLGPLTQLQALGHNTEERMVALNALAERVSLKAKVIESQQPTVEHALVQANRVNEMVWSMDVQIGKLNEGMKHAAAADETLARLERLSADTTERLAIVARLSEETERQTARLEQRGAVLLESLHAKIGDLDVDKKDVEAVGERLRVLAGAMDRVEARMGAFASQEKFLSGMGQEMEGLTKRFAELFAQSDELTSRQHTLEGHYSRLAHVDELARKGAAQLEWVRQGRDELDALRTDLLEFRDSYNEMARLSAGLAADRQAIGTLHEQLAAISNRAPELEAKVDDMRRRMSLVEGASQQAKSLEQFMSTLNEQLSRVEARASLVANIEARLNGLNTLSSEVDRRLAQQFEARTDCEILTNTADGIAVQIADAHHKLEALNALQARFLPLVEQVRVLEIEIDSTRAGLAEMKPDEAAVAEQEKRFADLAATSRRLESELGERQQNMNALADDLARSENVRKAMTSALEQVQSRQRDTVDHIAACDDQLARAQSLFRQLDERATQVVMAEKKLVAVDARMAEIGRVTMELDRSHEAIASREQLVSAVRAEVEAVHLIGARSKSDLDYVVHHRGDVLALRAQIDQLLSRAAETDQRLASLDTRRKLLDEVESKASLILDLLDDTRINLETIEEQKAIVEHVAQTAAQLEFKLQEARSVLATLQYEREQVERLEQGIKQPSLRSVRPDELKLPAAP